MPPSLTALRSLRDRVRTLNGRLDEDLRPFLHPNGASFTHKPKSAARIAKDAEREDCSTIDAATTATVLMALVFGRKIHTFYDDDEKLSAATLKLFEDKWTSVGLEDGNFFTASLVFRALGLIVRDRSAIRSGLENARHQSKSFCELVKDYGECDPETRVVGGGSESRYPLTPTLVYWLLDGANNLSWSLSVPAWERWAKWAAAQFQSQLSHVIAQDDAAMDPVALAMAACLVAKLRNIASTTPQRHRIERQLPPHRSLTTALSQLFARQGASGIWPRYFPLFVYPQDALVNHCFAFELLEALLSEFSTELLNDHYSGLESSVRWCEEHRLTHVQDGVSDQDGLSKEYHGWNSGANLEGLRDGHPECWATAVVHMFLFKLDEVLSKTIQRTVLTTFHTHSDPHADDARWTALLPTWTSVSGRRLNVKSVIDEILSTWDHGASARKRSALLFGPPGTSKTSLVRFAAAAHGWPCVAINPSHFLEDGLERIFSRANAIFADLMDLSRVVVFFDEMDPLVQRRHADSDIHHQSLTTVFLPKLADLYTRNRVVFFLATNHLQYIDPAIRRPGRFDYLLFVGPPRWNDKLSAILAGPHDELGTSDEQSGALELLRNWTEIWLRDEGTAEAEGVISVLDRFTVDEARALLVSLRKSRSSESLFDVLKGRGQEEFARTVREWGAKYIVLWRRDDKQSDDYSEFLYDRTSSRGD